MISGSPHDVTYEALSDDGLKTVTVNANTIDGEEYSRSIYHNIDNQSISNPKMRLGRPTENYGKQFVASDLVERKRNLGKITR